MTEQPQAAVDIAAAAFDPQRRATHVVVMPLAFLSSVRLAHELAELLDGFGIMNLNGALHS